MTKTGLRLVALSVLLGGTINAQENAKDLAGNWQGTLQAGNPGLRIVMKVKKDNGKLTAVSYSIDQGGRPIGITAISLVGSAVSFSIKPLDVAYAGTLSPDGNAITGNQTQGGHTAVLNFLRVTDENMWPIPEPPKAMPADAKPKVEVGTVKPSDPSRPGKLFTFRGSHVMTFNTNLNDLITFAYGLHSKQIVDAPAWIGTDKFDIDGKPDVDGQPSAAQLKLLIQSVLVDRFKLTFHHEQRELSVYALTVAKDGPKMTVTQDKPSDNRNFLFRNLGDLMVTNSTMKDFCDGMQAAVMDKPVVDHTGLTDRYDFRLRWTADESQFAQMGARVPAPTDDPNAPPTLQTALQEQLGLKLESVKSMADVIVIDQVEKPSAN